MHKAYRCTVGTVILKIESVDDKLQSQHVENLYDNKDNTGDSLCSAVVVPWEVSPIPNNTVYENMILEIDFVY